MERFCPTGKFSEEKVHLLRWTAFSGRTVLIGNYCSIGLNFALQYLSVINFWKFLSETEWNGSVRPGWCNQPEISRFTVPFTTGNFRNFKPEFLVDWKAPFVSFWLKGMTQKYFLSLRCTKPKGRGPSREDHIVTCSNC